MPFEHILKPFILENSGSLRQFNNNKKDREVSIRYERIGQSSQLEDD